MIKLLMIKLNICYFVFNSVTDKYKTQEISDKVVYYNLNALDFVPD